MSFRSSSSIPTDIGMQILIALALSLILAESLAVTVKPVRVLSLPANITKNLDSKTPATLTSVQKAGLKLNYGDSMANKGFLGLDTGAVMGLFGPLALAAMVSLPFMAPAAAVLLPLASITSAFGRRRRHLLDHLDEDGNEDPRIRRREKLTHHHEESNIFDFDHGLFDGIKLEKEKAKVKRYLERQVVRFLKKLNVAFENAERKMEYKR